MKKAKLGKPSSESELLAIISGLLPEPSRNVLTGIGDDCAVIRPLRGGNLQLLKTDAVVEGIHFRSGTPLDRVGWKALCRPLSDIAAMGGTPLQALVTVCSPRTWRSADWKSLYRGILRASRAYGVDIVGGETTASPGPIMISVTLTGSVSRSRLRLRSHGRPGDLLCVTGRLGGSLASGRHLNFHPRLAEGAWLSSRTGVTAMMDLSDGLGSDLPKLAAASNCSYRIAPGSIPLNRGCSERQGLSDGEDHELLLTVSPSGWRSLALAWAQQFPKLPLTCIGFLESPDLTPSPIEPGYDHLRTHTA